MMAFGRSGVLAALAMAAVGAVSATTPLAADTNRAILEEVAPRPVRQRQVRRWAGPVPYRFRSRWPATKPKRHRNRAHISRRVRRKHRRRA